MSLFRLASMFTPLDYTVIIMFVMFALLSTIQRCILMMDKKDAMRGFFQANTLLLFSVGWVFNILNVINIYNNDVFVIGSFLLVCIDSLLLADCLFENLCQNNKTVAKFVLKLKSRLCNTAATATDDEELAEVVVIA